MLFYSFLFSVANTKKLLAGRERCSNLQVSRRYPTAPRGYSCTKARVFSTVAKETSAESCSTARRCHEVRVGQINC